MNVSTIDLLEVLKVKFSDAEAKVIIRRFEQTDEMVDKKVEKAAEILDVKMEKAIEKQEKIFENNIKGLKEFVEEKFVTKVDFEKAISRLEVAIANAKAETTKQNFMFWVSTVTILAGLMIAILFKLK
jgi:hypothetical protein